jgi:regulator of replication initiation timing
MSAADTIRDVVRIATTAGITKDVIDLLERKAGLLAEQVAALEKENTALLRENRNLALENQHLNKQIKDVHPNGDELDPKARDILLSYFRCANEISARQIAQNFQMGLSVAEFHLDVLWNKKLIRGAGRIIVGRGNGDNSSVYEITAEGRKYIVENGLAD